MGVVYHARHGELGREVALKVLAAPPDRSDLLARFQREARAAAQLAGHPGIVGVYDLGSATLPDGAPVAWFSMELVRGDSLDTVINGGDLDVRTAVALVAEAARAAHHAHGHGLIHRDLKPANILVDAQGHAHVTDFGLVALQDVHGDLTRITTSDLLVGTPAYMAPEQVNGDALDPRADVWSLGATLYECLVGHPPFQGESVYSVLTKLLHEPPPPIRPLDPDVPAEVEAIVMHALEKDPAARYPSAAALADDLEAWLAGRPVQAQRRASLTRIGLRARRARRAGLVAGAVLAGAALAGGGWWLLVRQEASQAGALQASHEAAAAGDRADRAAQAWRELAQRTLEPMRRLEDHWNVAPSTPAGVAADLAAVRAAAADVQARYPDAQAPAAWVATAEAYAGRAQEFGALRTLVERAEDDPFPAMLLARLNLGLWAWHYGLPEVVHTRFEIRVDPARESPEQAARRELAAALLARITRSRAYLRGADADAELELLRAASLLSPGQREGLGEAAAITRRLLDHPWLSGMAARLYGLARFSEGEPADALAVWEGLAARRAWIDLVPLVAEARLVVAGQQSRQGAMEAARTTFQGVYDTSSAWLREHPDDWNMLIRRAHAAWGVARLAPPAATGEPLFAAGRADLLRAIELRPDDPEAWRDLLHLEAMAVEDDDIHGRDPVPRLRWALAQADRWLADPLPTAYRTVALVLRGTLGVELGIRLLRRAESLASILPQAQTDLAEALALRPTDGEVLSAAAKGHALAGDWAMTRGQSPQPHLQRAVALYRDALREAPGERAVHHFGLAETLALYAGFCERWGEDPDPHFAEALALAQGLEAEVAAPDIPELIAQIWVRKAEAALTDGRDPTRACQIALEALARARERRRGGHSDEALHRQANALWIRARWEQLHGVDPTASLEGAAHAYGEAIALSGHVATYRADRALVFQAMSEWAAVTGGDPRPHLEAALADQDVVVAALPGNAIALHGRGSTCRSMAAALAARGLDPAEYLARARDDLNLAAKLDATSPAILNDRGLLFRTLAELRVAAGEPATLQLELALQDFDQALALAPDHRAALNNRGNTYATIAKQFDQREEDPRRAIRKGIADFDRLLALAPEDVGARNNRALLHQQAGDAETHWGDGDPDAHYALAIADFDEVLRQNPQSADGFTNRGVVHMSRGERAREAGQDPLAHFRAAARDHTAALSIAPGDPGTLVNRAVARRWVAMTLRGVDATAHATEIEASLAGALQDLADALAGHPRLWQAHAVRGRVLADQGRHAEALAAYDAALEIRPGQRSVLIWRREIEGDER
jgi:tetratricopeptide (TPR) repeat protein